MQKAIILTQQPLAAPSVQPAPTVQTLKMPKLLVLMDTTKIKHSKHSVSLAHLVSAAQPQQWPLLPVRQELLVLDTLQALHALHVRQDICAPMQVSSQYYAL